MTLEQTKNSIGSRSPQVMAHGGGQYSDYVGSGYFPPGVIVRIAQFIIQQAPYPDSLIAYYGAEVIFAGIVGRAYMTPTGAGVNIYTLLLKLTGGGKDAVKQARNHLFNAIAKGVPAIHDTKGPEGVASPQGLLRWLGKRPCCASVFGEFGPTLKKWTSPRAAPHDEGTARLILQLYSSSGAGGMIEPEAYANQDNNTPSLASPSFSFFAESTPEQIYEAFGERLIATGMLPRFDVVESLAARPYLNRARNPNPDPALVQILADVAAHSFGLASIGNFMVPKWGEGAEELFDAFERWTTDSINSASSEASRQLWNRANLKALKRATLQAIAENYIAPVITYDNALWATNLVAQQTNFLLAKFTNGETGIDAGNEAKQLRKLREVIREYVKAEPGKYEKSGCTFDMHRDHVFSYKYLYNRLIKLTTFAEDKAGASKALERSIRHLEDNGEIGRITQPDMMKHYQKASKAYGLHNEGEFMKADD